jgi:hypothetical protein
MLLRVSRTLYSLYIHVLHAVIARVICIYVNLNGQNEIIYFRRCPKPQILLLIKCPVLSLLICHIII